MIHYHGTPITPRSILREMGGRNFCVSYHRREDIKIVHEIGQSVMLDNGAFTMWKKGVEVDWVKYYTWCDKWLAFHTTWAVIPDIIDGAEEDNDRLIDEWPHGQTGAPVWHLHESLDRLKRLCDNWSKVCFGSSGMYSEPGSEPWSRRIAQAFDAIAPTGRVPTWIHMLRGMRFAGSEYPFASADSAHVARNHHRDGGATMLANHWDPKQCPAEWHGNTNMELPCID